MTSQQARGFTLIELLVVIAIIGILSSVVLASLNYARTRARDSAVLANMDSLSAQTAIYFDTNGTYGSTSGSDCASAVFTDPTIQSALISIRNANGNGVVACYAGDTTYAVGALRPTGTGFVPPTVYWCAENTGKKCGINDLAPLAATGQCGCP